ncbi:TetR/AcrR family transcriptional regulator [Psychromicrobium lacuslunae]|uniref:TetR family transcriptional regulator n=1 Tax=Psychromicrobium lacuslunae TaxID=1618207 RepID=A0A0D4C1A2_9MICC|nr:TetR/AcrR family transcriptional regulator [Psychromicrobium lacuslunae]AJT42170.1 TetR family transcriptional regulator [Psychromicrobium lacuslunae]
MASDPAGRQSEVRRKAGRPTKAVLELGRITQTALKLVRQEGYQGLTMSALAKRLNVAPSALYNHVRSKQELLILIQDHLMSLVEVACFDSKPWDEAIQDWARSYRDVFAHHTPLIPLIAVQPITNSPQTLRIYEAVARGFQRAGWPEDEIVNAIVALESFIFGSALDVTAPENIFDVGELQAEAPVISRAVASRETRFGRYTAAPAFELGLAAIIQGLRWQLSTLSEGRSTI